MKNLVLFPDRSRGMVSRGFKTNLERFPAEEFDYFYVEDGAAKLIGHRFNDVYIHWFCHSEPQYDECVVVILSTIAFSKEPGQTFLFL